MKQNSETHELSMVPLASKMRPERGGPDLLRVSLLSLMGLALVALSVFG